MERYTKRLEDGKAVMDCANFPESWNTNPDCKCTSLYCRNRLRDRLAAIEDILGDEYDLDRLRELVEADREQRCFVFRFGFGSTVYRTWIHPSGSPTFITENKMDTLNDLLNAETWDTAYSTRAEAESALRREQDG